MSNRALAGFLTQLLSGTADIGVGLIPLIGAFKKAKQDPDWKETGLVEWIKSDPEAMEMLARAVERARDHIPTPARVSLILALGGTP